MQYFLRFLPILFFWGVFILVIFNVEYPNTIPEASLFQLVAFFLPLFLSLTFTVNLIIRNIPSSVAFSLGIILLLALKSLNSVNSLTVILVIIATVLLISYFKTANQRPSTKRSGSSDLTSNKFMPKLKNLRRKK